MPLSPECNENELRALAGRSATGTGSQRGAVFLYTPLCGTCAVARRMLEVVLALDPSIPLFQANVNAMPALAKDWRIESVPCLAVWENGDIVRKEYAMKSVEHLLTVLSPLRSDGADDGT